MLFDHQDDLGGLAQIILVGPVEHICLTSQAVLHVRSDLNRGEAFQGSPSFLNNRGSLGVCGAFVCVCVCVCGGGGLELLLRLRPFSRAVSFTSFLFFSIFAPL